MHLDKLAVYSIVCINQRLSKLSAAFHLVIHASLYLLEKLVTVGKVTGKHHSNLSLNLLSEISFTVLSGNKHIPEATVVDVNFHSSFFPH